MAELNIDYKKMVFDSKKLISESNPKEIISERVEKAKLFDIGNNKKRIVARMNPLHYKDESENWQDVSTDIENKGVHKCSYDVDLYVDKIGYHGIDPSGKKIELELTGVLYKEPTISGNTATYEEIESGVDFKLTFLPTGIKANRILKNAEANKTAIYRSLRESGAVGKLINLGADAEGRNTKLIITEEESKQDEKIITQVFDNKVMKMNETTRKREWSDEVTYPVTIDPTSTFAIAANADDGRGWLKTNTPTINSVNNTVNFVTIVEDSIAKQGAYLRFTGITIPQGSTINSATLSSYLYSTFFIPALAKVSAQDTGASPGNPTLGSQVISPATPASAVVSFTFTNTTVSHAPPASIPGDFKQTNLTVTTIVQELVNSYDYSSGAILLFINIRAPVTNRLAIYQRNWGVTQDAQLIVDFTEPADAPAGFMTTNSKYWR